MRKNHVRLVVLRSEKAASVTEFQCFEIKQVLYFLATGVYEMPKLTELESNACLPHRVAVSDKA
jgi:hypothetical protein